ncbi:hypothetical protein DPX16_9706 [Anabarilius grahami]|uniref:Uncharacterized protein n=1 Tax=Anabarilius grahami TaxID=495550 RepID=A0A3N0Y3E6_ANAGA|nr:hypothetical protein DPX16_9706 [Anabarilius grahami]
MYTPAFLLICLEQKDRSLEEHLNDFLFLATSTHFPESSLCNFLFAGLNTTTKALLSGEGPRGSFPEYVENTWSAPSPTPTPAPSQEPSDGVESQRNSTEDREPASTAMQEPATSGTTEHNIATETEPSVSDQVCESAVTIAEGDSVEDEGSDHRAFGSTELPRSCDSAWVSHRLHFATFLRPSTPTAPLGSTFSQTLPRPSVVPAPPLPSGTLLLPRGAVARTSSRTQRSSASLRSFGSLSSPKDPSTSAALLPRLPKVVWSNSPPRLLPPATPPWVAVLAVAWSYIWTPLLKATTWTSPPPAPPWILAPPWTPALCLLPDSRPPPEPPPTLSAPSLLLSLSTARGRAFPGGGDMSHVHSVLDSLLDLLLFHFPPPVNHHGN